MSDQVREVAGSNRQKKWIAGLSIALTLVVGILIGTVISGKTSAMKNFSFAGQRHAAGRAGFDSIFQFVCGHRESRGAGGCEYFHDAGYGEKAGREKAPRAAAG